MKMNPSDVITLQDINNIKENCYQSNSLCRAQVTFVATMANYVSVVIKNYIIIR